MEPLGSGHDDRIHEADRECTVASSDLPRTRQIRVRPPFDLEGARRQIV